MDEVNSITLLDENENSPTPSHPKLKNMEFSVSPLTSSSENTIPSILFQSPKLSGNEMLEVNSNLTIQCPKTSVVEMKVGVPKSEISTLDTSNGSLLEETVMSFKSCNGSFFGEVDNSFKHFNGSHAVEAASPNNSVKNVLDETLAKIQSPATLPYLCANEQQSPEENANFILSSISASSDNSSINISLANHQLDSSPKSILDSTVASNVSEDKVRETVGSDLSKPISFSDTSLSNDISLPHEEKKFSSNVFDDSGLDGALAAFSSLKLEDSKASPLKSVNTNVDNNSPLKFTDSALFNDHPSQDAILDTASSLKPENTAQANTLFEESAKDFIVDQPSQRAVSEKSSLFEATSNNSPLKSTTAAPEKVGPLPLAKPVSTGSLESTEAAIDEASPLKSSEAVLESTTAVPEKVSPLPFAKPVSTGSLGSTEAATDQASPLNYSETVIGHALPLAQDIHTKDCSLKIEESGNTGSSETEKIILDNHQEIHNSSNLMAFTTMIQDTSSNEMATLHDLNDVPDTSSFMDFEMIQDTMPKVVIEGDSSSTFDSVNDLQTFPSETFDKNDPFDMASIPVATSPSDDFVFKVPSMPAADEEFTDAVQFFKDPSSFQFLENIKTSPPTEGNTPRSSLYIKFDPLHSAFPKSSQGSNGLQAFKENNLDPNILNVSTRESLGNILISFDSPRKNSSQDPKPPVVMAPTKLYTEEELQQHLNVNELTNQEMLLKKQKEMEEDLARKEKKMMVISQEKDTKIAQMQKLILIQAELLKELAGTSACLSDKQKDAIKKMEATEEENAKLKGDVKTLTEDLQSVETTFADFHKRYEQCKGMLKSMKENEELLKTKLKEQEKAYQELQDSSHAAIEKASSDAASVKKTSEAQNAVLKAQLKKAELKISSLESDIKQIKIENSQLGGICDDLMEKVGKS